MAQRIGPLGTVRIACVGVKDSVQVVSVFWAKLTTSGLVTQADLDAWTLAFGNAFKTNLVPQLPTGYALQTCNSTYFVDGTPTNVMQSQQSVTGPGGTATVHENAMAIVISWLSGAYWRGGKPRTYLMLGSNYISTSAGGQWDAARIALVATAAANFRAAINALTGGTTITGTALGFVSFFTAGGPRVPPLFYAFTGQKIHPRIAHQRRRDGKWVA